MLRLASAGVLRTIARYLLANHKTEKPTSPATGLINTRYGTPGNFREAIDGLGSADIPVGLRSHRKLRAC